MWRLLGEKSGPVPILRAAALHGFTDLVPELELDLSSVLAGTGLEPAHLDDPDRLIPLESAVVALHRAAEASKVPHLGLLLAQRQSASVLGALGLAFLEAPDLRSAIALANRRSASHVRGARGRLDIDGETASWILEFYLTDFDGIEILDDLAVAVGVRILRQVLGEHWNPSRVTLIRQRPAASQAYSRILNCPVSFGEPSLSIEFPRSTLDRRPIESNPEVHELLKRYLDLMEDSQALGGDPHGLRPVILDCLREGRVTVRSVSGRMGVSPRTLQRNLEHMGTTFRKELDVARCGLARRLLEGGPVSTTALALMLDYSSPAAFSRAFRRVVGVSPSQWRLSRRTGDQQATE